ncbi:MAG: thyX [Herbinix sp.]|jgi:thymidylate synthase (FAD)|nr:thyX [Herbinix sp.]
MKCIKPSFEISIQPEDPKGVLQHIEKVARVCYKSEGNITEDGESAKKLCTNLISRGHEAMIEHSSYILRMSDTFYKICTNYITNFEEHGYNLFLRRTSDGNSRHIVSGNVRAWRDFMRAAINITGSIPPWLSVFFTNDVDKVNLFGDLPFVHSGPQDDACCEKEVYIIGKNDLETLVEKRVHYDISVKFIVDRGVSHELVRHRVASFGQESTRYCNYSNDKFGSSITVIDLFGGIKLDAAMGKLTLSQVASILAEWEAAMEDAEKHYLKMMELGATAQISRSVLPNSTKTEITFTSNIGEWQQFFSLRLPATAHPQMREVTSGLHKNFVELFPDSFQ